MLIQPERPHRPGNTRRMHRGSSRLCADAPATPPQNAAPRPVRRTRAGARRTSGPERLPGTDSKLATSRRRPVDAQARPRQASPSGIDRNSVQIQPERPQTGKHPTHAPGFKPFVCRRASDTASERGAPPSSPNTRGGKANERPRASSGRRFEARDLATQTRGCASTPRQAGPSGIDRNSVLISIRTMSVYPDRFVLLHRNAHEPDPSHPVPKWRRPRLTPSRTETLGASTARRSRNRCDHEPGRGEPRYRMKRLEARAGRSVARAERARERAALLSTSRSAGDTPEECREPPRRSKPPRSGPYTRAVAGTTPTGSGSRPQGVPSVPSPEPRLGWDLSGAVRARKPAI